jgi:predicted RNA-binding Zn ribbon-like protein
MTEIIKFPLISGRLSIDLVNTEVVSWGVRRDLLSSGVQLIAWLNTMQNAGAIHIKQLGFDNLEDIECHINENEDQCLSLIRAFRAYTREEFEKIADGYQPSHEWVDHLESLIKKSPFSYRIIEGDLMPFPIGDSMDSLLSLVAFDILQLLSTGILFTLHKCENPDCVLLFFNESGRRKWCSMKICGNRIKVARHGSRKKAHNVSE